MFYIFRIIFGGIGELLNKFLTAFSKDIKLIFSDFSSRFKRENSN